ncbi:MAG: DUF4395 domain-containing protein [Actinomycetota bacterium]|nr:DUF4395 domain-containing protein [Actinomycetota bacterium]
MQIGERSDGARTAHPYEDLDVIDARAPRFNQAAVALMAIAALITGWWGLLGIMALQLIVGLRFGRRFCLPCAFYFEVVQPRLGEGEIEDARPPRFANIIGAVFLSAATLAYALGMTAVGAALAVVVAALASLAVLTGFCAGCEMYKVGARLRGIRPGRVGLIDLDALGAPATGPATIQFTHPLCTGCRELEHRLRAEGRPPVLVDVSKRPEIARRYHVAVVPTAFTVDDTGRVLERIA